VTGTLSLRQPVFTVVMRRWCTLGVVAALALAAGILVVGCGGDATLPGTDLGKSPAPDFRLTDQAGRTVALSDLRGKAVVLTFMYTNCTDFCPLTAEKLRQTLDRLGRDASRVEMVAVSVDPERDDQRAVQAFTAQHRLPEANWHYLIGRADQLQPVWAAYGIGLTPPAPGAPAAALGHTDALYLIDTQGRERTLLRGDFDPAELADGLRTLVK
jgi:protein SCO1/2